MRYAARIWKHAYGSGSQVSWQKQEVTKYGKQEAREFNQHVELGLMRTGRFDYIRKFTSEIRGQMGPEYVSEPEKKCTWSGHSYTVLQCMWLSVLIYPPPCSIHLPDPLCYDDCALWLYAWSLCWFPLFFGTHPSELLSHPLNPFPYPSPHRCRQNRLLRYSFIFLKTDSNIITPWICNLVTSAPYRNV